MTWVALSLAGGLGAWLRFTADTHIRRRHRGAVPIGTLTINLVGSFLLGVLTGVLVHHPSSTLKAVAGTGLLGGFTTFSTATVELVNLAEADEPRAATLLGVGMIVGGLLVGALGLLLGDVL